MTEIVFGKTTIGSTTGSMENNILGTGFECPQDGFAISLAAALGGFGAGKVKGAIYNVPEFSLLAVTEEVVAPQPSGWIIFKFPTRPQLLGGVRYLFVCWSNLGVDIYMEQPTLESYIVPLAYNDFPASLAAIVQSCPWEFSIYCTISTLPTHLLTVSSTPITGIPFTIGGVT